jgi:DNA-binding NarL/FixJ family response regulator
MEQSGKIRVVLVESQRLIREALRALLEGTRQIEIVGEAAGPDEAASLVEARHPDVLVLSIDGRDLREIGLFQQLPRLADLARPLVITSQTDPNLHARLIELGAMGIVLKTHPAQTLVKAVRKVSGGELWLDRAQTADLVSRLTRRKSEGESDLARIGRLTARERQIVTVVTDGLTNKELAGRLGISEATVRNHLTSVLEKLGLSNRFQLAVYAFRKGLVPCPILPAIPEHSEPAEQYVRPSSSHPVSRRRSAMMG